MGPDDTTEVTETSDSDEASGVAARAAASVTPAV